MRELRVEISDPLAAGIDALVNAGWFASDSEVARQALVEFVRRHQLELTEQFQLEDVTWALSQRQKQA